MFRPHHAICSECKQPSIVVVKKMLCGRCNHQLKQDKKKASGKKVSKSFASYGYKEPTGESDLFSEIAEEREWICFVYGDILTELKPQQFAHVLPKALNKYPLFKLNPRNIVLLSDKAHYLWDFGVRAELRKDERFNALFELEEELKKEYKNK